MMRHLGSIEDVSAQEVLAILDQAEAMRGSRPQSRVGRVLALAFFQASARTRIGFAAAGIRLGFGTTELISERYDTRMTAAESLGDTVRVISAYADAMVLRHPSDAAWATAVANAHCPLINGGNGNDEHPTQALIDLFAVRRATGRVHGLRVGIVGDIVGSRSAHSLMKVLALWRQQEFRLMGPASRANSTVAAKWAVGAGAQISVLHHLNLRDLDIVYVAGLPEGTGIERLGSAERASFSLTQQHLQDLSPTAAVLCPLPRIDEMASDVDEDPRCRFFEQSDDGLWIRMAVLAFVCEEESPTCYQSTSR
jgi:aspartate carbamoyltransferase catalytic subunit